MKETHPRIVLESIKDAYSGQFMQELDPRFLNFVVEKEIQKKREAFLQVQLSTKALSIDGLLELSKHLKKNIKKSPAANGGDSNKEKKIIAKATELIKSKQTINAKNKSDFELDIETDKDLGELSEEEIKKLKRRAYARQYYHRKKAESAATTPSSAKLFKTTPEQRAYQRAYYKRRKTEGQTKEEQNLLTRAFAEASAENTHNKDAKNPRLEKSAINGSATYSSDADKEIKKPSVNYDLLAADRMAIENAFRADSSNDSINFPEGGLGSTRDGMPNTVPYTTKTKLRKAKPGMSTSS